MEGINYEELVRNALSEMPEAANPDAEEELDGATEQEAPEDEPEVTDPDELTEEDDGEAPEEDEPKEKGGQSKEDNARFAAARRKAEQERDAAIEKARAEAQAEMDALVARMGLLDPETGKPITTKAEYDKHQKALAEAQNEAQRQRLGMDKAEWDKMVAEIPEVAEARQQLARNRQAEQQRQREVAQQAVNDQIAEIGKMDPAIQTLQDLAKVPEYGQIVQKVQGGMNLLDAYKLATYDSRMQTREAARQNAINNLRSKNHLTKTTERGTGDERVPSEVKKAYRKAFPNMTDEEIQKDYNRDLKRTRRISG